MAESLLSQILFATIQAFVPSGRTEDRHRHSLPPRRLAHALGRILRPLARRNRKFEVKNITQNIKKLSAANTATESFFVLVFVIRFMRILIYLFTDNKRIAFRIIHYI